MKILAQFMVSLLLVVGLWLITLYFLAPKPLPPAPTGEYVSGVEQTIPNPCTNGEMDCTINGKG